MSERARLAWLAALAVSVAAAVFAFVPPIAQPQWYHDFADRRAFLGLPNFLDVASNLAFVAVGAAGLCRLPKQAFIDSREARPYRLFFFATVLIGFGSGYYHLAPGNDRLLWDRAAMMMAFMAWFAAIVSERVSPRAGLRLLPLLLVAGLGSVAYWGWSEARGIGDLRPYGLMQLYPMLLIPLLLWLYPPRYSGGRIILAVIGLYVLALMFDLADRPVFALTGGAVSGHTIKHAIAALAVAGVALHLQRRRAL